MSNSQFSVQTAKISGTPSNGRWSQIHTFSPDDEVKIKTRGSLFAAISLKTGLEGVAAVSFGREILGRLHEEYYGNLQGTAFEALRRSFSAIIDETSGVDMVAGVIIDQVVYLAAFGGAGVWLKRGVESGVLVDSNGTLNIISGVLADNDYYLLGTADFLNTIPIGTIKTAMNGSLDDASETLNPIVMGHEVSGGMAALLITLSKIETPIVEAIEPELAAEPKITPSYNYVQPTPTVQKEEPSVYLRGRRLKIEKKKLFFAGLILLLAVLAIVGVSILIGKINNNRKLSASKAIVTQVETDISKLKGLSTSDPQAASELASQINQKIDEGLELNTDSNDKFNELKNQVKEYQDSFSGMTFLKDLPLFIDISMTGNEVKGISLASAGKNMAVAVEQEKKLLIFDIEKKSFKEFELNNPASIVSADTDKYYALTESGIEEVSPSKEKSSVVVEAKDWGEIKSVAFYSSNLYLLDAEKNSVLRYPGIVGGFGVGKNWLTQEVDLSKSSSLSVDGSVWILSENKISRFSLGKEENFEIKGLSGGIKEGKVIYTDFDSADIYILDKGASRFYKINKNGETSKIYQSPVFGESTSMAVNGKKAYFLSGSKIFELGIE